MIRYKPAREMTTEELEAEIKRVPINSVRFEAVATALAERKREAGE